jgi:NAD+ kinase
MNNLIFSTKPTPKARAAEAAFRAALGERAANLEYPVVVAIGGDGTMLQAIKDHWTKDTLFVGISAGRLGFLQTIEPDHVQELADALVAHSYQVIQAPMVAAKDHTGAVLGYAFNDISVERHGPRAAKFSLHIGESAGTFIGDGVIFATPLGSTAYNLAAGGPIIDSAAQDIYVVTPNNPHVSILYSSLQRPHILGRERQIKLRIDPVDAEERPTQLIIDSWVALEQIRHEVTIFLSTRKVKLLELTSNDFHNRIEGKRLGRY